MGILTSRQQLLPPESFPLVPGWREDTACPEHSFLLYSCDPGDANSDQMRNGKGTMAGKFCRGAQDSESSVIQGTFKFHVSRSCASLFKALQWPHHQE
jgi:hypothetical protein